MTFTSAKEAMLSSVFCLLITRLHKNYSTKFQKIRWKEVMEETLDFGGNPDRVTLR